MNFLQYEIRTHVICLMFITIVHFQHWRVWSSANQTILVCDTPECKKLGEYFKQNMNERTKPCNNFYDYVCHEWGSHNQKPKYEEMWNLNRMIEYKVIDRLKKLLENRQVGEHTSEQAKALYRACMNLPFMDQFDPPIIKETMKQIGNWPMFLPEKKELPPNLDWSTIDNKYIALTGESAFLDYNLKADVKKDNRIMLYFTRLYSPYGMLKRYDEWESEEKKHYKAYLNQVINAVAPTNPTPFRNIIDRDLDDVIKFRIEMDKVIKFASMREVFASMTITMFQALYMRETMLKDTAKINWFDKIRAMYKNSRNAYGMPIDAAEAIRVEKSYFPLLAKLLATTTKRVIVNHIHLYFAERHLKLNSEMVKELEKSYKSGEEATGKIRYNPPRSLLCINENNLRHTLGRMYVKKYFSMKDRYEVHTLVEKAKEILKIQISQSTWLNTAGKSVSTKKVDDIFSQIGFPDWYLPGSNASYDKDDLSAQGVDAYYSTLKNKLYLGAGYLQPPIYNPNTPYVINIATLIALSGHELYHAFDTDGVQYWNGKKEAWLPKEMHIQHNKQFECFAKQYKEFRKKECANYGVSCDLQHHVTSDEDVADVMGLKLAYKAYKQKLQEKNGDCPVLPGFEKFGCEKLFFIAFANTFCESTTPTLQRTMLLNGIHSTHRIRVNGAVANMREFSETFNCEPGDPLRPEQTCDLWKE